MNNQSRTYLSKISEQEERNQIRRQFSIVAFVNRNDESFFPQIRKMVLFETLIENNGEGKGDVLTSFKLKEFERPVTRADIGVKLSKEVPDMGRSMGRNWRRYGASCIH